MLVVDAACLFEVVTGGPHSETIRERMEVDSDHVAPHIVDVEVFGVIRQKFLAGQLDRTLAAQAVQDTASWGGERFDHRPFLDRAWALRDTVRGWDAMYVALAEALDATLITLDARLSRAEGPTCSIEVVADPEQAE